MPVQGEVNHVCPWHSVFSLLSHHREVGVGLGLIFRVEGRRSNKCSYVCLREGRHTGCEPRGCKRQTVTGDPRNIYILLLFLLHDYVF